MNICLTITVVAALAMMPGMTFGQTAAKASSTVGESAIVERLKAAGWQYNLTADGHLYQIFAGQAPVSSGFLIDLAHCDSLQSISLGEEPSHFAALERLPELPTLESLGVTRLLRGTEEMDWVHHVPNLEALNLEAPQPEPKMLERPALPGDANPPVAKLCALKKLLLLRLNRQPVTAEGLAPLADLQELFHLELNDTPVNDVALKQVANFTNLQTLHLAGTAISDRGVVELGRLERLTNLNLSRTAITDETFATLVEFDGLRQIQCLYLADTKITNEGLKRLADLKSLQVLDLENTKVSDAGLVHLAALKGLYNINLAGVRAEAETIDWLRDQLPNRGAIVGYRAPPVPSHLRNYRQAASRRTEIPILQACQQWKKQGDAKSAQRVVDSAVHLREEVTKHLPFSPYSAPIDFKMLSGLPQASPGRHTLLNNVQYVSERPPGPRESYINTCLAFIDGDLLGSRLPETDSAEDVKLYDGYISRSILIVDGVFGISSYIADSIVVASGPIVVGDGYISNSLVISLDMPAAPAGPKLPGQSPRPRTTVFVKDGYISNSLVIGHVDCEDLRNCIIVGSVTNKEPYLRGAEILESAAVMQAMQQIGDP